jgi:drug/metabolite transporter (DMT)-like permease
LSPSEISWPKKLLSVASYLVAAVSGAAGQFFFKMFSDLMPDMGALDMVLCPYLWLAIVCYFGVMGLFLLGLYLGGDLSTLYPVYGSTFVWALIMAYVWLDEEVSIAAMVGTGVIILGITLLFMDTTRKDEGSA